MSENNRAPAASSDDGEISLDDFFDEDTSSKQKEDDITNDEDQGPIDFENIDEFGGYNVKNDEYENNNVNNNTQNEQQKINIKDDDLNW